MDEIFGEVVEYGEKAEEARAEGHRTPRLLVGEIVVV